MISLSTIASSFIEEGFRILKVIQYGPKTADECSPFGDDANPLEDMDAIFAETEVGGEPVIIGYIQSNRISRPGEKRIFSMNEFGEQVADIYLKNTGYIEIGGKDDNFVSYKKLNEALQLQNQKLLTELQKISVAFTGVGGVYITGDVSLDISASKTEKIRCLTEEPPAVS